MRTDRHRFGRLDPPSAFIRACLWWIMAALAGCSVGPKTVAEPPVPAEPPAPAVAPATAVAPVPAVPRGMHEALAGKEVVTIANDAARLVVCPGVGRIVVFGRRAPEGRDLQRSGRRGGENLLWFNASMNPGEARAEKGWLNWGGDKIWPAWQPAWPDIMGRGWPPDEVLDGEPWKLVERGERRIVIESRTTPHVQVRVRREIELAPEGPRVTIRNTMERVAANRFPVHILAVTQVRRAEFYLLHVSPDGPRLDQVWHDFDMKTPLDPYLSRVGAALRFDPPEGASKVGTHGSWIAGVYGDTAFVQHTRYDPAGTYPDKSCVQLFSCNRYAELETLSPQAPLAEGRSMANTVTWTLVERPAGASVEELVELFAAAAHGPTGR